MCSPSFVCMRGSTNNDRLVRTEGKGTDLDGLQRGEGAEVLRVWELGEEAALCESWEECESHGKRTKGSHRSMCMHLYIPSLLYACTHTSFLILYPSSSLSLILPLCV